jgi:hypothetical protein
MLPEIPAKIIRKFEKKILIQSILKVHTKYLLQKLQGLRVTCNPCKFEIPALRFPRKDPVNPCNHLQVFGSIKTHEVSRGEGFIKKK